MVTFSWRFISPASVLAIRESGLDRSSTHVLGMFVHRFPQGQARISPAASPSREEPLLVAVGFPEETQAMQ